MWCALCARSFSTPSMCDIITAFASAIFCALRMSSCKQYQGKAEEKEADPNQVVAPAVLILASLNADQDQANASVAPL